MMTQSQKRKTKGGILLALVLVGVNLAAWGRVAYVASR
jgi:hypothetical protein